MKPTTTRARLAHYRAQAAKYPTADGWKHWRTKGTTFAAPSNSRGDKGQIYSESLDQYGELLGSANELAPRSVPHTGWFTSETGDTGTLQGYVVKLRCPRGTLYVPATAHSDWCGTTHYINDAELVPKGADEPAHDRAIQEAARSADYYAEREAEAARADDAKFQTEQDIELARETIHETNRACLALLAEVKAQRATFPPAVCEALRHRVNGFLTQRAEQFRIIAARQADYWTAGSY